MIYFLDMGLLLPGSDIVLANFDEPLDEGVVVEACYGKMMGKFIIGLRTDSRSPYGPSQGRFGGMHFFPGYQCDAFVIYPMPCRTPNERTSQVSFLVKKVDQVIMDSGLVSHAELPTYLKENTSIGPIIRGAELLFEGIPDLHSDRGLEEIAGRYLQNKQELEAVGPRAFA